METVDKKDMVKEIDDALRFLEEDEALSASDIDYMMADAEARTVVSDLLDCKQAVRMASSRPLCPHVDDEWKQFAATHTLRATHSVESESFVKNKYPRRAVWMGAAIGVAASLLLLLVFSWFHHSDENQYVGGNLVFEAQDCPQEITLQSGDGDAIAIDEHFNDQSKCVSLVSANEKMALSYQDSSRKGQLAKPSVIQLLTTPIGKDFKVVLSDGTQVWLNADSRLEYPSRFDGKQRVVKLDGEAYFAVAKDAAHPFIVQTDKMETRVLGTKFNVRGFQGKDTHITLIEGSVVATNRKTHQQVKMLPGEEVVVTADGKTQKNSVDIEGYVYWQEGFFYFDNQPLIDIMQSLGRWYNVNIVFANKQAENYRFHYLCDRKGGIDHAITLLNRMRKLRIVRKGDTVIVK